MTAIIDYPHKNGRYVKLTERQYMYADECIRLRADGGTLNGMALKLSISATLIKAILMHTGHGDDLINNHRRPRKKIVILEPTPNGPKPIVPRGYDPWEETWQTVRGKMGSKGIVV